MLNNKALKKPPTSNPLTIEDASNINKALITKVNSPKVKIFIGRVIIINIGLIIRFIIPITIANIKAGQRPLTSTPGIK